MTLFTNFSHEKIEAIQTVHGFEISFATTNCPILKHFYEILMQNFNSITYIPKQNLPHYSAFLFRNVRAQRDTKKKKQTIADRINEAQITIERAELYHQQIFALLYLYA